MDNNIHNSQNDPNDLEWKNNFSKLNEWDSLPPLDGWDKISEQLDKPSRPKFLYWFVALGLILLSSSVIGFYLISLENNSSSDFVSNTKTQTLKEDKKLFSDTEKSDINQTTKSNLAENKTHSSFNSETSTINSTVNKVSPSKTILNSTSSSKAVITTEKMKNNIISETSLSKNEEIKMENKTSQVNSQAEITENTIEEKIITSNEPKRILSALEKKPIIILGINANPFFEMKIKPIKVVSNGDKMDNLSKNNASLPKKSTTISKWKIASYTGFGLTYKHLTANPNDKHYVKMLNEKQNLSKRQSLTFGFMAEKELSKKWNAHADIGILKWKNTVQYDFWGNYYSAPTKYIATKISTNQVSIQPIFENRDNLETQTLNYETTYFKTDLGLSYSLFQSKKWKHQIGLKTGILILTNENTNYDSYQNTTYFPSAKSVIPFFAGFHQSHYQLTNHWGIFGESSLKYLPNSVGDKNTIWQMRFYQINLHLGISYKL